MQRMRFILMGGFLGAGKTTMIGRLARIYGDRGCRVGLVTNDQASDLVDTQNLRAQGFAVEEVAGACFCCSFATLVECVSRLAESQRPDVILGEPVGSCTDLAATVLQPLKRLYADRLMVTPLVVLVDPYRARKILTRDPRGGFSPKAAYIYEKQLEEADAIAVNKTDALSPAEVGELLDLLAARFPHVPALAASGRHGDGVDRLLAIIDGDGPAGRHVAEVDYDVYAEGEAELGWLNSTLHVAAPQPIALDRLALELVTRLGDAIERLGAEVAHLKVIARAGDAHAVANLVRTGARAELSRPSPHWSPTAQVVVNARVFADPTELRCLLDQTVTRLAEAWQLELDRAATQCFRPARPVPTHRYTEAL